MSDLIDRQAAIDVAEEWIETYISGRGGQRERDAIKHVIGGIKTLPSAQPDITDEQAILHLQASGWMQSHDKQMYEMGLKERLADDSDSYDALLPATQPEIMLCKDCKNSKHWYRDRRRCFLWSKDGVSVFDNGFCNYAERRQDD